MPRDNISDDTFARTGAYHEFPLSSDDSYDVLDSGALRRSSFTLLADADEVSAATGKPTNLLAINLLSTSATLPSTDNAVLVDASSGAVTVTLPAAADNSGRQYAIKKTDVSGNAVTIDGSGAETIDGSATKVLASQYDATQIICDGTEWWII